jgi:hypothetical protein
MSTPYVSKGQLVKRAKRARATRRYEETMAFWQLPRATAGISILAEITAANERAIALLTGVAAELQGDAAVFGIGMAVMEQTGLVRRVDPREVLA